MASRRTSLVWLPACVGLAAGASLALGQPRPQPSRLTPAERAQCAAAHGQIAIAGLSGEEMCALPYRDAGRSCKSSSQCAGDCRYEGSDAQGDARRHRTVSGRCQAFAYPYGCRVNVENGRVTAGLCVD
jgi:hypothetical protein